MEIDQFVAVLKPFTKFYIFGSLILGFILSLKIINPYYFVLTLPSGLINPLRHITSLLFMGSLKLNSIINLVFFFYTNNSLETSFLPNNYGDFVYMIIFAYFGNLVYQKVIFDTLFLEWFSYNKNSF